MVEININSLIIKIHSVQVSLHLYDKYYHFIAFFAGAGLSDEQCDNINIETAVFSIIQTQSNSKLLPANK